MSEKVIRGQSPPDFIDFPENWPLRQVRTILDKVDDHTDKGDERLLSVSKYYGVSPRNETIRDREFRADSTEGYIMVQPGGMT
jgi:hypothetical protein